MSEYKMVTKEDILKIRNRIEISTLREQLSPFVEIMEMLMEELKAAKAQLKDTISVAEDLKKDSEAFKLLFYEKDARIAELEILIKKIIQYQHHREDCDLTIDSVCDCGAVERQKLILLEAKEALTSSQSEGGQNK